MTITKNEPIFSKSYKARDILFYLDSFYSGVLIPDKSTEILTNALDDILLPLIPNGSTILDVGAGCGLHSVFLGKYLKKNKLKNQVIALDISKDAVSTVQHNLAANGVADCCTAVYSDMFSAFENSNPEDTENLILQNFLVTKKAGLIISNPPMMPAKLDNLNTFDNEVYANLDYRNKIKDKNGDCYSDGLGLISEVIINGYIYLEERGKLAIVTADFLGEQKIEKLFLEAGFPDCKIISTVMRKIRKNGFTWNQMEIIELLSGYVFFDKDKKPFSSVAKAKESGKDIYYNAKVYMGMKIEKLN